MRIRLACQSLTATLALGAAALLAPLAADAEPWRTVPLADSGGAAEVGVTGSGTVAAWQTRTPDRLVRLDWARVEDGRLARGDTLDPPSSSRVDVVPLSGGFAQLLASRNSGQNLRGYEIRSVEQGAFEYASGTPGPSRLAPPPTGPNTAVLHRATSYDGTAIWAWIEGNRLLASLHQPGTEWGRPQLLDRNVIPGSLTVAAGPFGDTVVAWAKERDDGRTTAIRAARSVLRSWVIGVPRTVAVGPNITGNIALGNVSRGALVIWQESRALRKGRARPSLDALYARTYAGPQPLGAINRISPRWRIRSRTFAPTVLSADGGGLVAWQTRDGKPLYATRVRVGKPVGNVGRVPGSVGGHRPQLATAGGRVLLTWDDYAQGSSRPGRIFATVTGLGGGRLAQPDFLGMAPAGGAPDVNLAAGPNGFAVGWRQVSAGDPFTGGPAASLLGVG